MNVRLKAFIEENIDLINNEQFARLFQLCPDDVLFYQLTEALTASGIDFTTQFKKSADNYLNNDESLNNLLDMDVNDITYSVLQPEVDKFKKDLAKFSVMSLSDQDADKGLFYKKYAPLLNLCNSIERNSKGNNISELKLRRLCSYVTNLAFPYGWKQFENYYTNPNNILDIGKALSLD